MSLKAVKIEKVSSHSTSGRLKVCNIYDGCDYWQVVCGAGNVKEGMKTVHAPVGSTTPAGIEIQKAELRGVSSEGMLCSARDLSISDESGIVDLPLSIKEGTPLEKIPTDCLSSIPWHSLSMCGIFLANPRRPSFCGEKRPGSCWPYSSFKDIL